MKGIVIGIVIIIILVAGVAYLYTSYGSLPASLLSALTSGKQLSPALLESIVLQKVNASPSYNIGYSGHVTFSSDPSISFSYQKYLTDRRSTITVSDFPIWENATITVITLNNSQSGYLCINASPASSLSALVPGGSNNTSICTSLQSSYGQVSGIVNELINTSTISNVNTTKYTVSTYDGQPCYFFSGRADAYINSTLVRESSGPQTPATLSFDTCFSASEDIPLTVNATFTAQNGQTITVSAYNSGLNFNATQAEVTSLPGNVIS